MRDCKQAGFDGFIFPDLPLEESKAAREMAANHGLILSMLIAPTTKLDRAREIAKVCTGFVYVVSRAGITGARAELPAELPARLTQLRQVTDLPMAVGFGVSSASQVNQVVQVADAAIVGSAIVKKINSHAHDSDHAELIKDVSQFVRELSSGLKSQPVTS
jgi:tryptophan synthase alpha subunit